MKLSIFSHCALDTISIDGNSYEQIGGAASYCGLMAREFKFDVNLFTKFGSDFPKQYLTEHKINLINSESDKNTTKFSISISGTDRTLKLENECDPIDYSSLDADGHIVSPIFHEISNDVFKKIKDDSNFLFVDPQGFLRQKDSNNNIILKHENTLTEKQNELATLFKALSHPARVAIIEYLLSVDTCICGDIVDELPLSQSTVSQHLKELKEAGLIEGEITGVKTCYCINEVNWKKIGKLFDGLFTTTYKAKSCC